MSSLHHETAPVETPILPLPEWLDRGGRGEDEPPELEESDYFDRDDSAWDDRAAEAAWYDLAHHSYLP